MPDHLAGASQDAFRDALEVHRRRLRLASAASAALLGSAAGALAIVVLPLAGLARGAVVAAAVVIAVLAGMIAGSVWWVRWRPRRVALTVDRSGALDNLVVTAEEIAAGRARAPRASLTDDIFRAATGRLQRHPPSFIAPLGRPLALAAGATLAFVTLLIVVPSRRDDGDRTSTPSDAAAVALRPGDLRVIVTPPSYIRRAAVVAINPVSVTALEGSRVRLEMARVAAPPVLVEPAGSRVSFDAAGDAYVSELTATTSRALLVRQTGVRDDGSGDRLVSIAVQVDARPVVTIRAPAKDLLFGEATANIPIEIEARDDVALDALALRFTRVSGSGEGFTFKEGELPIQIARRAANAWEGRATIALGALGLEEGDSLVYHATARDQKPGVDASVSESFLIEIGKVAGIASTGFALPDDRERQSLSQQMLIVKTERLEVERPTLTADALTEQAKLLGIEQRMVRAEFVFMTGGEVADEVEEAAAAHELTEGRLENQGQAELLTAVREMSRAEARLNAADTAGALIFERAALRALQRAFDRRRYLLRATPERARIDLDRRLQGDLTHARSSVQERRDTAADPVVARARAAMLALTARDPSAPSDASLAATVLSVEPGSEALRTAALRLSSARTPDERRAATIAVAQQLDELVRARLAAPARGRVPSNPLRGRVADELSRLPR